MLFILGILFGIALLIFILQNMVPVTVMFFGWQMEGSLALLILLAILAGVIINWLFMLPGIFERNRLARSNRVLKRDLDDHKQMLSDTEIKLSQAEAPVILERTVVMEPPQQQ